MIRTITVCFLLLLGLGLSAVLAAGLGSVHLAPTDVLRAFRHGPAGDSIAGRILWPFRLPRICLAALIGASLASAGVAFQSLLRNDLADPYLVGTSAGASVGAEVVLLRGQEMLWRGMAVPLAAFVSAACAMTLVYSLARRGGRILVTSLLLGGVVISAFLGSISALLLTLAQPSDMQRIQFRLGGSLQDATFDQCGVVLAFLVVGFAVVLSQSRAMNLFALGEEAAQQLGVDCERLKTKLILTGSLLTAATVAVGGIIGFVGLIVPHAARRLCGTPDHRRVLPVAALCGAILMVWADTVSRTAFPDGRELPVGIVTAFLGAPFFIYLMRRHLQPG